MNTQHPRALDPLLPEMNKFFHFNHYEVLYPLLRYVAIHATSDNFSIRYVSRIFALGMDLLEDTFVEEHSSENYGQRIGQSFGHLVISFCCANIQFAVSFMK